MLWKKTFLYIKIILGVSVAVSTYTQGPVNHTASLVLDLFRDYNNKMLPKLGTEGINLTLDMALNRIIYVDKKQQTVTSTIWVRQYWTDYRLSWNTSNYGGIRDLVLDSTRIWVPDVTLYNNARDGYHPADDLLYQVRVNWTGEVSRFYPVIYTSSCNIVLENFPFDDQVCTLKFGSWTYNMADIDLYSAMVGDTSGYVSNGEWHLLSLRSERHVTKYRCCPHPFPTITYSMGIRRRPLYYITNFITPCLIVSVLIILSFVLPTESGERLGMGITILLSLCVIQLLLAQSLPSTSIHVPLMLRYYGIVMIDIGISILLMCLVLILFHHPPKPLPLWVKVFVCQWCAWALGMRRPERRFQEIEKCKEFVTEDTRMGESMKLRYRGSSDPHKNDQSQEHGVYEYEVESEEMDVLLNKCLFDRQQDIYTDEWKFIAQVVNKLFMWILLFNFFLAAGFVFWQIPRGNMFA